MWFPNFALPAKALDCIYVPQAGKGRELGLPHTSQNWANSQQECWHTNSDSHPGFA